MLFFMVALAATPANPDVCENLSKSYEHASKRLASSFADGAGDNSAARATMRATQDNNVRQEARDNLDLMKANGCKMPTSTPNASAYMISALRCRTAQMKFQLDTMKGLKPTYPEACDLSKWVRDTP